VAPGRPAGSDPGAETTPQEQTAETSPAEAVLPSADYIDKLENEESKSPLFWVLGGIAAALGGVVLFLTRKMKKKPGFKQENKEG
jgi:hypothetical protein